MASAEAERMRAEMFAEKGKPEPSLEERRADWLRRAAEEEQPPEGTEVRAVTLGEIECEWVRHPEATGEGVFFYLHGGGYVNGSSKTHHRLASFLSRATGLKVLLPDYRLAPEHPFPAAVQDALAAFGGMLKEGVAVEDVVVGGDSAGGGLALSLLIALRDAGAPMPAGAVLLSPWTDLSVSAETYDRLADVDPSITREGLAEAARQYLGRASADHPLVSPLFADLNGLPPLLVQVGAHETMIADSTRLAERAEAAGVEVTLETWPEMWHVWQNRVPELPEAVEAIDKIGVFVRGKVARVPAEVD